MTRYINRMPQPYKDAWTKGLRSGEYIQDEGCLQTSNGFCCLGVLQHVINGVVECDSNLEAYALPTEEWAMEHSMEWKYKPSKLPYEDTTFPHLKWKGKYYPAYQLNDVLGLTFDQIADLIEEQIEGF